MVISRYFQFLPNALFSTCTLQIKLQSIRFEMMLYQRQKIALALLEALGGFASATDFQKLLFLYTQLCEKKKSYDFIPYRFGCYSFQSAVDKSKLADRGYLIDEPGWRISKKNQNHSSVLTTIVQSCCPRFARLCCCAVVLSIVSRAPKGRHGIARGVNPWKSEPKKRAL